MELQSYMEEGRLVPDEMTIQVLLERLRAEDAEAGVVFDGFPRNLKQAEALDEALAQRGKAIDGVIYIRVSEEELLKRLSGRWICRHCQTPYHATYTPPKIWGKCDKCGGKLYQRPDDTVKAVRKRLEVYAMETAPLVDHYTRQGKLIEIDGKGDIVEVGERIVTSLREELSVR
jgi:adenylate kinase